MHGINGGLMEAEYLRRHILATPLLRSDLIFKVFIIYTLNLSILIYVRLHDERRAQKSNVST